MKSKIIISLLIACVAFSACSNPSGEIASVKTETAKALQTGYTTQTQTLPSFKLESADGNIINLSDLKGKKVFINLWATWCPPCRAEIPSIEKLYKKIDKKKVAFIMLSLDNNFGLAKRFAKAKHLQLPVFYPAENLPEIFNINGIPATFIFDEKGELIKANMGMDDYNTQSYIQLLQ
ncbi:MAG: TlpA family protein disulfide reductase [Ginsengibacter sp.]